ncbi:hypothetical protein F5879DRAFT_987223 [Lentinula edodes]|uniref:uncharacterized protein n=1 Tax=Lentinula edodes TaxID=5353 RepID=UPI001E8D3ED3|nr:uncharacterized protein C8R40DRAFT_1170674 [Lentinula edodes]KAH7875044.1 hypothetical protein C8R40DRAFT_1170674 [Lentinula edodes]KAJ3906595.1 hypothetical protein F5879DRAFT_987223 [Lentinula edodes]KAJ3915228.1 hypothetical protein F5877DRAFT_82042 [Lentinula edodes]
MEKMMKPIKALLRGPAFPFEIRFSSLLKMGPQRATRRSAATRHHPHRIPEVSRRHPMLTRSMGQVHPAPAFTRMNGSSSNPEASTSALDTDSNPLHCSSSQGVSGPPFLQNLIAAPLYSHVTQSHSLHEASSSSLIANANFPPPLPDSSSLEASSSSPVSNENPPLLQDSSSLEALNPPSTVDITSSDLSSEARTSTGELPSKPGIPVELLTHFDQRFIRDLELFDTRAQRLFNEQKNSLEFAQKCIEILTQQCIVRPEEDRRFETRFAKDGALLSLLPRTCMESSCRVDTPLAQTVSVTDDNNLLSLAGYFIAQFAVERIATNSDISPPPSHSLAWPERQ